MRINKTWYMLWDVRIQKATNNQTWFKTALYANITDMFKSGNHNYIFAHSKWVNEPSDKYWSTWHKWRRLLARTRYFITDDKVIAKSLSRHLKFDTIWQSSIEWCRFYNKEFSPKVLMMARISNLEYKEILKYVTQYDYKKSLEIEDEIIIHIK